MVMQQGTRNPVWGKAPPASLINVSFLEKEYRTMADDQGKWRILLDPAEPGGPWIMEIDSLESAETITLKNIYIGDVWLCSGQSNMELPMQRIQDNYPEEWEAPNPLIRQFKVPQEWRFSGPQEELSGGAWTAASAKTLSEFSGTAWFFAQKIFEKHPAAIGLVNTAWGGTPVEAWMSREALAPFPQKILEGEHYADSDVLQKTIQESEAGIQAWESLALKEDRGSSESWQQPETDESAWRDIHLPGSFSAVVGNSFSGVIWLRRTFTVPASLAGRNARIWLGTIVDSDIVFINGVEVGNTPYRYPPRKYNTGEGLLREGKNTITIRVVCNNGEGGITMDKPFRIFTEETSIELAGVWKCRTGMIAPPRPEAFFPQRQPMGLYNAMIAPLLPFPIRGILWYQGESNDTCPNEYAALFTAMIQDYRRKKQQDDLPFLFVQLPVFGQPGETNEASSWAIIREAQLSALALPATGMAAGLDLGEWNDLHPLNKKGIGYRLALAAEQVVFKNKNTAPGPLCRSVSRQGNVLLITFDNCGAGLAAESTPYLTVAAGGKLFRLPAKIESPESLSVDISSVENPEKILYAWAHNPQDRQLHNSDGLPALPFKMNIE